MEVFIFARFHARPAEEERVKQALQEVVPPTQDEEGCLSIHVFRSIRDPQVFYLHSRWRSEEAFETHTRLPHTARFVQRVEFLLDHKVEAQRCTMIQ